MTDEEKQLLENVLDALDRFFDRESSAVDLQALIFATSRALLTTQYFSILNDAAHNLSTIVNRKLTLMPERGEALTATNDLRIFLARTLD